MKSVDTNILLRVLLNDDPKQSPVALEVVRAQVFVPITVMLELGWVLGSRIGLDRKRLSETLLALLDMPEINVADEAALRHALQLHARSGDFADMLHLVAARGTAGFVTFDKKVKADGEMGVAVEVV